MGIERLRQKLRSGAVPRRRRAKTWIGPGRARPCMACDQTIARDDTEVECDDGQPLHAIQIFFPTAVATQPVSTSMQ